MNASLEDGLRLPCGLVLPNRLAKAAMTEGLADERNRATAAHVRLYRRWAKGGAGLLITGNIQVDRRYLERPGNVVIDSHMDSEARRRLCDYAASAQGTGSKIFVQLSHGGRQSPASVCSEPIAPSPVPLNLPRTMYAPPRAMREDEIFDVIDRFARAAAIVRESGFSGVQIHAAHGYLLSQFLSPLANRRTDQWGGSLENRSRLVLAIIAAVRREVGHDFPVALKLNAADFQQGGFSTSDAENVASATNGLIDLLEITGGTYEAPAMAGAGGTESGVSQSTLQREAYFVDYAERISRVVTTPIMATGGFRTKRAMNLALQNGSAAMIGVARPFCVDPDLAEKLLSGHIADVPAPERELALGPTRWLGPRSPIKLLRSLNVLGQRSWFFMQLRDLGQQKVRGARRTLLKALKQNAALEASAAQSFKTNLTVVCGDRTTD